MYETSYDFNRKDSPHCKLTSNLYKSVLKAKFSHEDETLTTQELKDIYKHWVEGYLEEDFPVSVFLEANISEHFRHIKKCVRQDLDASQEWLFRMRYQFSPSETEGIQRFKPVEFILGYSKQRQISVVLRTDIRYLSDAFFVHKLEVLRHISWELEFTKEEVKVGEWTEKFVGIRLYDRRPHDSTNVTVINCMIKLIDRAVMMMACVRDELVLRKDLEVDANFERSLRQYLSLSETIGEDFYSDNEYTQALQEVNLIH